ncbi:ABC transporter ATP-binding protein [Sphaerotilus hippei]|uniref:ABC transporter ATP-binding protein n=1 Tax=Sphaerotilus hippei TaxID=744406 RepID=UPI001FEADDFE|nr:ABC transporter ATP-binding protein [Sphaerotilus hippei]
MSSVTGAGAVPAPVLEIRDLVFRWPGAAQALEVGELSLAAGESLFLHGPSGCGKSTLLSLCAGVLVAPQGRVALLGQDWRELSATRRDRWRADHAGYLFQQFNLLSYCPVLENVMLPCRFSAVRAQRCGAGEAAWREQAQALLAQVGLEPALWSRAASVLSVGQQQRVAAARALIGRPALVIADEPTSALDAEARDRFMALLHQACEAAGSALLFVSHDRSLAASFDRVVDLRDLGGSAR